MKLATTNLTVWKPVLSSPYLTRWALLSVKRAQWLRLAIMIIVLISVGSLFSVTGHAADNKHLKAYQEAVKDARQTLQQKSFHKDMTDFDPLDYCQDATCRTQVKNPDEKKLSSKHNEELAEQAAIRLHQDDGASAVLDGFYQRPYEPVDPNDLDMRFAVDTIEHAYEISHGIRSYYHDCQGSQPLCQEQIIEQSCQIGAIRECLQEQRTIHTMLWQTDQVFCESGRAKVAMPRQSGLNVRIIDRYTQAPVTGITPLGHFTGSTLTVLLNGSCTASILNKLKDAIIILDWIDNRSIETIPIGCTASHCQIIKNPCTQGEATRKINGHSVTLPCWQCVEREQCPRITQTLNTCQPLKSCNLQQSVCLTPDHNDPNTCLLWHKDYQCTSQSCDERELICGEVSFCLDGECYDEEPTTSDDFDPSVSALAVTFAAANEVNHDQPEQPIVFFAGQAQDCSKNPVGFSDCCAESGWGQDLNLTECTQKEHDLGYAKSEGRTVAIGTYCASEVLGVCVSTRKSYCVFPSKLAKIVQRQGREYTDLNWGTPKQPDCRGFTPEQLQSIPLDQLDLSALFDDIHETMALPDSQTLQDRTRQAVLEKQQAIDPQSQPHRPSS